MSDQILYVIGQALGILAVILGFISYQMKTPGGIILFQLATAFVFTAHYACIGAVTAIALNLLGAFNCLLFYFRDKRGSQSWFEPVLCSVLIVISGILTFEGWHSLLIMVGLVFSTVGLALGDPQKTRYSMLVKSPLCLLYNGLVHSFGGVIYECAVLTSSVIGIVKHRRGR